MTDQELREGACGFVVLTVASTIAATLQLTPNAVFVVGLAGFAVGILVWIVAVERRAPRVPWPFGSEEPHSKRWPDVLGLVLSLLVAVSRPWPTEVYVPASSGLGSDAGFVEPTNVVYIPESAAMTVIASFAVFMAVPLIARVAVGARRLVTSGRRSGNASIPPPALDQP